MNIEIEDENTWPDNVVRILDENLQSLIRGQSEQINYSKLPAIERGQHKWQFRDKFDHIIEEINLQITDCHVVGYHCTRLLGYEIDEIREHGFMLPSTDLLQSRLQKAQEKGHITRDSAEMIGRANEYKKMPFRENRLYFVCGVSALKDEHGVHKFFQCWGGEAVYNSLEESGQKNILFTLGEPVIIQVRLVPKKGTNLGRQLAYAYLIARNFPTEDSPGFDYCVEQPVTAASILKIIRFSAPQFLEITKYQSWDKERQPVPAGNSCLHEQLLVEGGFNN